VAHVRTGSTGLSVPLPAQGYLFDVLKQNGQQFASYMQKSLAPRMTAAAGYSLRAEFREFHVKNPGIPGLFKLCRSFVLTPLTPFYSIGDQAVTKSKMLENFGAQYVQARLEGVIMGRGANKEVRVKWTNLQDPNEFEYGFNHGIFKDPSAPSRQKAQKMFINRK
jgi:hypothetical protein